MGFVVQASGSPEDSTSSHSTSTFFLRMVEIGHFARCPAGILKILSSDGKKISQDTDLSTYLKWK
jgi:hypothetical protein